MLDEKKKSPVLFTLLDLETSWQWWHFMNEKSRCSIGHINCDCGNWRKDLCHSGSDIVENVCACVCTYWCCHDSYLRGRLSKIKTCPLLQPLLTSPRPMHFLGTLQTCHSTSIHQMPSDFPTGPSHLTPTTICSPVPLSPYYPPQYSYQPIATLSWLDRQCCFLPLLSSLLNLNLNSNVYL